MKTLKLIAALAHCGFLVRRPLAIIVAPVWERLG